MRRKDKEIVDEKIIKEILSTNTILRLALCENNVPYVVPLNYGYSNDVLYFHSAKNGKKLDIINENNNVSFEISDSIEVLFSEMACDFGTKYRSVIGYGKVQIVNSYDEKIEALDIIMKQHTPSKEWEYSESQVDSIAVIKIIINKITGKSSGL